MVKGKLQSLPEEMQALTLNLSYYTEVGAFQKVCGECRESQQACSMMCVPLCKCQAVCCMPQLLHC